MKAGKRLAGLMMCVVLAVGCLSGCGGMSDTEILSSSVKSINEAKNFDVSSKMSGSMTLKMGDISQDIDMSTEMTGTQFTDPYKMKATSTVKSAGTSISTETYMQKVDDNYVVYVKINDEWTKMTLGNLDQALATSGAASVQDQLSEDVGKYTQKDDREIDGKAYLVYDYTVSGDDVRKMVGTASSSLESMISGAENAEMVQKLLDDMFKDLGDITMTILIDRETNMIYQIEYSMTEVMNKMLKSLMNSLSEIVSEEAGEDETEMGALLSSMEYEVKDMNMVMTYSNVGSAADFEIPQEALDAEETSMGDL